jgi:type VI secretion system secreted protein VgrG
MSVPGFDLQAGPNGPDRVFVTSFEGLEVISRPFEISIDFFSRDGEPLDLQEMLGQVSLLTVPTPTDPRHFHGILESIEALGESGGRLRYRARLVPALQKLAHVRRSRLFLDKKIPEVVKAVLDEAGIEHRLSLSGSYAKRDLCVQYRETDLAFVSRLLEHEGIFYFFEHSDSGHVMVLGDSPQVHPPIPGAEELPYRVGEEMVADGEYLVDLEEVRRTRSAAVMVRDFDFVRPSLDLTAEKSGDALLEVYDYPAEVPDTGSATQTAQARLQERRMGERTLDLKSHCPRLCAGMLFTAQEYPVDALNQRWLAVEVRHHGKRREVLGEPEAFRETYRNEARCLPADVPFRPPRRTPRPTIAGLQTATVVGPSGEEIHPDEHGRAKVKFHWDRAKASDDTASCWIRVAQSWGGPAWGALFMPRAGQEVLVRFLEGNPDRPLICGAVYNGAHPPPAQLPDDKTQSAVQSSSSPGGDGYNEIRFEDAAGSEEVAIHGQKDATLQTENNKDQQVGRDEALEVKKDRKRTVNGHQSLEVVQNDRSVVKKDQDLKVTGKRDTQVRGTQDEEVVGNQTITVAGSLQTSAGAMSTEDVGLAKTTNVGGASFTHVKDGYSIAVGKDRSEKVAGSRSELVVGFRDESVDENRTSKVKGDEQTQVDQGATITIEKDWKEEVGGKAELGTPKGLSELARSFELKADKKLNIIVNGKVIVSVDSSGKVQVNANKLTLDT